MDKNGYNESILDTTPGRCYLCTRILSQSVRHEIYFGPTRKISKVNGFWVNNCPECHTTGRMAVHRNPLSGYDIQLKRECQIEYEKTHSRAEFMELIGKNYL